MSVAQSVPHETSFLQVGGDSNIEFVDIVTTIFAEVLTPLYGMQDKAISQIRESYDRRCLLMLYQNQPAGIIVYKLATSNEYTAYGVSESVEVKSLFLYQPHVFGGKGLGTLLMNKLLHEIGSLLPDAKGIHLTVSESVPESMKFFMKKGFQIVHTWDGRYIPGIKEHLMFLPLSEELTPTETFDR